MTKKLRVRFAPSPTGYLHVGGGRTALFNYLFARHYGGTFILRLEDTDRSRYVEAAVQEIYDSLRWLKIEWDEGPDKGGDFGPYIQSERLHYYKKYAEELVNRGHAYYCFCTPERLSALRAEQEKKKENVGYDKLCRRLSIEEVEEKIKKGIPYVIRFKIPENRKISFQDLIRGVIEYESNLLDDFVLLKADGFPTYHLANVVDDHLMEISHVLRGDEWITSTPRHVLMYEAFGWESPQFAHLPIILSPDGGKLSKRKGAASVLDYKRAGYLPEALVNFLALLGWAPGDNREKMSMDELISSFTLEQISPKAAVFDETKLEWMNGVYLAERSVDSIVEEIIPLLKEKGLVEENNFEREYIKKVVELLKIRSKKIPDLVNFSEYFFKDPVSYEDKAEKKYFSKEAVQYLQKVIERFKESPQFTASTTEAIIRSIAELLNIQPAKIIHPVRLAVSGVSFGPGLFEMLELIGKERVIKRMEKAIEYIEKNK
ncbi:MAG: glutamate--tRNA ligase [Chitinispirillaceae bacterium]|nr:glutamate--tRNA ligase [Chitinispirillaceae bacterium]